MVHKEANRNQKIMFDDDDDGSPHSSSEDNITESKYANKSNSEISNQNNNQKENGMSSWNDNENAGSSSESEDEEEDDDGLLLETPTWQDTFLQLLPMIKTKDPKLFEKKKFFDSDEEDNQTPAENTKKKEAKPLYMSDYLRNDLLETENSKPNIYHTKSAPSLAEETEDIKSQLLAAFNSTDDADILVPRKKSSQEVEKEEKEFQDFLQKHQPKEKQLTDDEILEKFWKAKELDDKERFLRDFIINQKWMYKNNEEIPSYQEIVQDDEEFSRAQNTFEQEYNKNNAIESFPRNIETSARIDRNAEKRKKKREERKLKKEMKLKQKEEELKKMKNVKKKEIISKLKELESITGSNVLENFDTEDFDPADFDKKMSDLFGDEFYEQDDTEKPVFEDNSETDEPKEKPVNPNAELKKEIENIIDEYYKLDYEDLVGGDVPTRFKYIEVPSEDFGLSPVDILTMDDDELNKIAPLKMLAPYRTGKRKLDAKQARKNKYKQMKIQSDLKNNNNNNNTTNETPEQAKTPKEKTDQAKIRKARITYRKKISKLKSKLPPSEMYRLDDINSMELDDLKGLHKTLLGLISGNSDQK
mmetsp:Transcript_18097/g.25311  ORF Transcript_18097/g.25311 Transcript_18097/m.25311 type:complete len:588 (-) Transcript_18097:724-2487(-)